MSTLSRRVFLGTAAVAPAAAWAAPSGKVVVGIMGMGGRGTDLARTFAKLPNVEIAYVCDPDEKRAGAAADAGGKGGGSRPKPVADFRRILDDKAVDALVCAAPNHWHAPATILACTAGKHVYVEKPCSHTAREAELMVEAARKHGRLVQVGTQRRSFPAIQEAMAKLHDGVIGRAYFAQGWYANDRPSIGQGKEASPPAGLDYDLWQGPASRRAFHTNYLHYNWHWFWAWGNGELGNNGVHAIDVMRWGLGVDLPAAVGVAGGRYRFKDDQETPDTQVVSYDFADGKTITWEGFSCNSLLHAKAFDCLFQGETGSLLIQGNGYIVYDKKGKEVGKGGGAGSDTLHTGNFVDAVRGSAKLNAPVEIAAASTMLCHLGNIAYRVGRRVVCEPKTGRPANDTAATKLWSKEYEKGWEPKV